MITHLRTVIGNLRRAFSQRIVVGENSTTVTVAAQVLGGEETGATHITHTPGLGDVPVSETILRSDGLACVLYNAQMMLARYLQYRLHVGALTEQMNRHDSLRPRRDSPAYSLHIDVETVRIDIHQHRLQTQYRRGLSRSNKSKRRCDHLVTRAESQTHQGYLQRVRAVAYRNHVLHTQPRGQMLRKLMHLRTLHKSRRINHFADACVYVLLNMTILRLQIHHLNRSHWFFSIRYSTSVGEKRTPLMYLERCMCLIVSLSSPACGYSQ